MRRTPARQPGDTVFRQGGVQGIAEWEEDRGVPGRIGELLIGERPRPVGGLQRLVEDLAEPAMRHRGKGVVPDLCRLSTATGAPDGSAIFAPFGWAPPSWTCEASIVSKSREPCGDGQSRRVQEAEIESQVVADDRRRGGLRSGVRGARSTVRIDQIDAVAGGELHELERIAAGIEPCGFDIEPEHIGGEQVGKDGGKLAYRVYLVYVVPAWSQPRGTRTAYRLGWQVMRFRRA